MNRALLLCVRRFYCRNSTCARRTFVEPLPDLLAPRARRTRRLALTQGKMGFMTPRLRRMLALD